MKKIIFVCVMFFLFNNCLLSQVSIHPRAVFLDKVNRSGSMLVMNPADEKKEVSIELKYGFPDYDSLGNKFIHYVEDGEEHPFSAVPKVRVFPKKLIMEPKSRQTVRFIAMNFSGLESGIYTSRIVVSSKNVIQQIDTTTKGEEVKVGITIDLSLVAALILKNGYINTGLEIKDYSSYNDSASMNLLLDFERTGNSPFWGKMAVKIFNSKGSLVDEIEETTPLYFSAKKAFKFDKTKFADGTYRAEIDITNEHPAIPDDFKSPFEPYHKTIYFEVSDTAKK